MKKPEQYEELLGLLSQLADAELDDASGARLEEILSADPHGRVLYMQHVDLQVELACMAEAANLSAPTDAPDADAVPSKIVPMEADHAARPRSARRPWALAAAAIMVAGLALFLWRGSGEAPVVARLDHIKGDVLIIPEKGLPWSPDAMLDIRSSYTIRVRGEESSAVLVYPDGTLVALVGGTELAFGDSKFKDLEMTRGVLAASVTKQPAGHPMTVATPKAEIEVVGTEFTLEADAGNTHLAVLEGAVDFIRNTDTHRVQVTEGEVSTIGTPPAPDAPEPELVAEPQSAPPPDWSVDFEAGLPPGWAKGELETTDLPPGSRGAARAQRVRGDDRVYHQIEAPSSFVRGLYQISSDTHLHITYKMDAPNWVNLFIGTRSPELRGATWDLYKFVVISPKRTQPGVWQTITIPMSEFKPASGAGDPILGKVPCGLLISSINQDRGLVVDAIWVTQGGPGRVKVETLK